MKALKFIPLLILAVAIAGFSKQFLNHASISTEKSKMSQVGTVVKVADGDTLTVDMNGKREKIRLCGIDAPEQKQALGRESKALLQKLALGKEVAVTEIEKDRYNRIVAEVFVLSNPEQFVNGDMVQNGMAYHYSKYSSDCPNKDVIIRAEAIAQQKRAGVWSNPNSTRPWNYRHTVGNK